MKYAVLGSTSPVSSSDSRQARAYCDGWSWEVGGGLVGDNPFTVESERENKASWDAGFADSLAGTINVRSTHCSISPMATVPDIVGLTAVNADALLSSSGLAVGTVTNATDPVTAQGTVAGTKVNFSTAIDYTLTV